MSLLVPPETRFQAAYKSLGVVVKILWPLFGSPYKSIDIDVGIDTDSYVWVVVKTMVPFGVLYGT